MSLLEVEALDVRFGNTPVVRDVSFAVRPGERLGIVGESGSGKSLTALATTGLLPDVAIRRGSIRFGGADLPTEEKALARLRGKRIGMVFQEPMTALNPLMRIGAQIREAMDLSGINGEVSDLLSEVELEPGHARRYPHQLSGGQRQRVMIAMALASQPELLIADEPTSALDLITQATVLDLIDKICEQRHMALLFISHDLRAVARLCPRVAVMQSGAIVESGTTAEVFGDPQNAYTQRLVAASRPNLLRLGARGIGETLVAAHGLTRRYRQGGGWFTRHTSMAAVDGTEFDIARGEAVALVGPSGCGKSTLARMLAGLEASSAGEISFMGRIHHGNDLSAELRRDVSLVFQDPFSSFDPRLTVGDSLAEPLRLLPDIDKAARQQRVSQAIESVGLTRDMLHRYPHAFSGGQRQRLAIARAIITRPKFLILDEPVSALDVSVRGEILALLMRLQSKFGLTYLVISHDLDMVRSMADRVMVMEAGRIVETGRPADLFHHPQHALTRSLIDAQLPEIA